MSRADFRATPTGNRLSGRLTARVFVAVVVALATVLGLAGGWPTSALAGELPGTGMAVVSGTGEIGAALSAQVLGGISGTVTYEWHALKNGGDTVVGADSDSYTPTQSDLGSDIVVHVTITPDVGDPVVLDPSLPVTVILPFTHAGTVSITYPSSPPRVGDTLTVVAAGFAGGAALHYQWLAGMSNVGTGQTTYTVQQGDLGKVIDVVVTASEAGHTNVSVMSADSAAVVAHPVLTAGSVSIAGSSKVGLTVSAKTSGWDPAATLHYAWKVGALSSGSDSPSFTIPTSAAKAAVTVTVTATRPGYTETSATSSAVTVVQDPTLTAKLAPIGDLNVKNAAGWYRGRVKIVYSCKAGSGAILYCPSPDYIYTAKDKTVTKTITARDGGRATVVIAGLNVDPTAPRVEIVGLSRDIRYSRLPHAKCKASDPLSGIAKCTITHQVKFASRYVDIVEYDATAYDNAGNSRMARWQIHTVHNAR
jgi:hypothetical protein